MSATINGILRLKLKLRDSSTTLNAAERRRILEYIEQLERARTNGG